jgi:phospholipid/cholesterol/gamma-HCH transport system substrate-binding protein
MATGSSELKVGIFVTVALIVGGLLVFVIGNQSAMFAAKAEYFAEFDEVSGLRAGSPVRIAGIDVGTVTDVSFNREGRIRVRIEVREDASAFVREGSVASVGSKGLLGDQLVEVTVGQGERIRAGGQIPSAEPSLLTEFLGETGEEAASVVHNVNTATAALAQTLSDPQVQRDVRDITHNLATLTRMVSENDGTARRLLTDPALADDIQATVQSLQRTSGELEQTIRSVRGVAQEVQSGDGTAHRLIYGDEGIALVGSLATVAGEVATVVRDVRTGQGNAHQLIYGDQAGNLISNLTVMSGDLRAIVSDVRAGRGTIGGLLVDPSIYEDIKRLVGNLERNVILRSLVRYSIREDEARPPAPRPEPAP